MITDKTFIRVRYAEVDRMGYLHHGNYAAYFEVGRTELLRKHGLTYKIMEEKGVILPVREINVEYLAPAYYDELLCVHTFMEYTNGVRLVFNYKLYNEAGSLLCNAKSILIFVNASTRKPIKAPKEFLDIFYSANNNKKE